MLTIATKAVIINRWAVTLTLFIKSFVGTVNWAGIITQMNLKMWTMYWTKAEKPSRTSLWCCFFYVVQSESWFQVWPFKQTHFKITSLYLIKNEANCWGFRDIHLRENRKTWLSRCKKNTCFWKHWKQLTRLGVWHSGFRIKHFKTSNSKTRALLHCFKRTRNAFKQESSGFGQLV